MDAEALSKPGSEYGPCTGFCLHRECAYIRGLAEAPCRYCKEVLGYEVPFYWQAGRVSHAVCEQEAINKEPGSKRKERHMKRQKPKVQRAPFAQKVCSYLSLSMFPPAPIASR